jgi:CRISPR-associated endonuclease/helicase Cas3
MIEKVYAKSNPPQSIEQHTDDLLKNYELIKNIGYLDNDFVNAYDKAIKIMIRYHDYGKLNHKFQNKIRSKLNIKPIYISQLKDYKEIPHEWLSLCFISEDDEDYLYSLDTDIVEFFKLVQYCIAFHHSRSKEKELDRDVLKKYIEYDLEPNKTKIPVEHELSDSINLSHIKDITNSENFDAYFPYLVFFKGLLHKCDYCASADIDAEVPYDGNYRSDFQSWLDGKGWELRGYQKKAMELSDKSIVFIASTGAGKTEYSMSWIDGDKAFYLLGLRIAVNKMFERFTETFKRNVALLHGDVNFNLVEEVSERFDYFQKVNLAKKFSYPLTIATADQLITSVFKYNGFELTYFVASYSKIVVDEIQSFAPEAIASIVVFLKEIHRLGGKFLLMTATLPPFIRKEFEDMGVEFPEPVLNDKKRHRIKLYDEVEVTDELALEMIRDEYESGKKVLVICNTVRTAQEMTELLSDESPELIHSKFIAKDRSEKEKQIMEAVDPDKNSGSALWISTQIVEASLDIDFDVIFTEGSTVDSMFQRFGRCWRSRDAEYESESANIMIFKPGQYSTLIYDGDILSRTLEVLKEYDGDVITEQDKQDIIEEVFADVENTKYYSKYKDYKELLRLGFKADNKKEAQKLFRMIENSYMVIPVDVYKDNKDTIDGLLEYIDDKANPLMERIKRKAMLHQYTMGIQIKGKDRLLCLKEIESEYCQQYNIKLLKGVEYDFDKGIRFIEGYKDESNFIV